MKFPAIKDVADELRLINCNVEGECDVRLQVYEDGLWVVRYGASDYDQDHRGFWGASCLPGVSPQTGKVQRCNSYDIARELIEQVRDQYALTVC
jgi:hypothetical protein